MVFAMTRALSIQANPIERRSSKEWVNKVTAATVNAAERLVGMDLNKDGRVGGSNQNQARPQLDA